MKKLWRGLLVLMLGVVVSCVTINIYFPAEEIRGAADRIVEEVYGEKPDATEKSPPTPGSSLILPIGPAVAYAAQDINVSTPEIRAIKADMKARFEQLATFLNSGHAGIDRDGLLQVRSTDGLNLKQRADLTRMVADENKDRQRLYQEIARANGFPDRAGEVQGIFADSWREKANKGWFYQDDKGAWQQK